MDDCIFCNIASGSAKADIVAETDEALVFRDIHPKAPVHLLVVPKRHIVSLNDAQIEDRELLGALMLLAAVAAKQEGISDSGYKVATNVGKGAGQIIFHLHFHVLGGWEKQPQALEV